MLIIVLLSFVLVCRASNFTELEDCSFSLGFYEKFVNVRWSSDDQRQITIQSAYSFGLNQSEVLGHIYPYLSQSVALIPFFVQCHSLPNVYLPFRHCSSTIKNIHHARNYEGTRTNLILKTMHSLIDVPILYITESTLLLLNCSFEYDSTVYRVRSNETFTLRVEFESPINTPCYSCNQKTSICLNNLCQCRENALPVKLHRDRFFCIDNTQNCSLDQQRCLYTRFLSNRYLIYVFITLIILICLLFCLLLIFIFCLFSNNRKTKDFSSKSEPAIFTIERHQRTPSTLSTTDSLKFYNDYLLPSDKPYPQILVEDKNGDFALILV